MEKMAYLFRINIPEQLSEEAEKTLTLVGCMKGVPNEVW